MSLTAYTITALERDVSDATASGKQVIVGASCSMYSQPSDTVVTLYDDSNGGNGSTAKVTGENGQVVVYIEPGEYRLSVNGIDSFVTIGGAAKITTVELIALDNASSVGDVIETTGYSVAGDGGGAQWVRVAATGQTPSQTPSQLGSSELIDGSGRKWELAFNATIKLRQIGGNPLNADDSAATQAGLNSLNASGGGTLIVQDVHNIDKRVLIKSNTSIEAENDKVGGFLATSTNTSGNGLLFGATTGVSNWGLKNLALDGSLTNTVNTRVLMQSFASSNWSIEGCIIKNSSGIALNISTSNESVTIKNNSFENIGFNDGVGGTAAKQAIAFSSGGHKNVKIKDNSFKSVGLDCISIGGIDGGEITGNCHADLNCYTLLYNDISALTKNITVNNNKAKTQINVGGSARPQGAGIDLPNVLSSTVSDNVCLNCASCGIGIFQNSGDIVVSGNVVIDCNQSLDNIHDAGIVVRLTVDKVTLTGNISRNKDGATQSLGLLFDDTQKNNLFVSYGNHFDGSNAKPIAAATFASNVDVGTVVSEFPDTIDLVAYLGGFNEFGGDSNEVIAYGEAISSTIARLYIPIISTIKPTSSSFAGSFDVYSLLAPVVSGVTTASLSSTSSPKVAVIDVTGAGLTAGDSVNLRCAVSNSKISIGF